jgi:hypothetical protein
MERKNIKQHDYWEDGNLCCPFCSYIVANTDDYFSDASPCIHTEFCYSYEEGNYVDLYDEKLEWFFDGINELKSQDLQGFQTYSSSGVLTHYQIGNVTTLEQFIFCLLGQDKQRVFIELDDGRSSILFSFNPNN